jgi:hypothetical protein
MTQKIRINQTKTKNLHEFWCLKERHDFYLAGRDHRYQKSMIITKGVRAVLVAALTKLPMRSPTTKIDFLQHHPAKEEA